MSFESEILPLNDKDEQFATSPTSQKYTSIITKKNEGKVKRGSTMVAEDDANGDAVHIRQTTAPMKLYTNTRRDSAEV